MTKQEQFFYDNAGFSYPTGTDPEAGHIRCAQQLAEAERFAQSQGWRYEIEPDNDADDSWMDHEPQDYQDEWRGKAWYCQLWDSNDGLLASLSGCYGDSDYERVVKAELALEAMKPEDFADYVPSGDIPLCV